MYGLRYAFHVMIYICAIRAACNIMYSIITIVCLGIHGAMQVKLML